MSQAMVFNCSEPANRTQAIFLFQSVAYMPVFAMGLILNTSVLWHFSQIRQWTDTHIYMVNLLLADFLLILFLPFRIFETYCPMKLTGFCTFLICVHYSNMYTSIFTITAITAHRFVAIRFPMRNKAWKASDTRRKTIASVTCALIWVVVMTICTVFLPNMLPDKLKTCYRKGDKSHSLGFLLVLEILGYLLPIAIIMTCSMQAIWVVLKSLKDSCQHIDKNTMDERKTVVAIITANMIVFIVCFTPIHAAYLLRYVFGESVSSINLIYFYDVSEWLATTNCCLDAVGYYFLLKKVFRNKS